MPCPINRLTDELVATLDEPRLHANGTGLYLRIDADGSRRWSFIYHRGRRREMSLGVLRYVPLGEARRRAQAARLVLACGADPIDLRRAGALAAQYTPASTRCSRKREPQEARP